MISDTKILAFLILLIVQVVVSIVYKLSQTKGTYTYSPLSVIASAEFIKLCISSTLLLYTTSTDEMTTTFSFDSNTIYSRLSVCYTLFQQEVKKKFVLHTFGLALLYVINNQLAFVLFLHVDIASIAMFKSFSSIMAAILLWAFFERNISKEQWGSIILQVAGLCIVQYDSCQNTPFLAFRHYVILVGSTLITAVCSVWNEHLIKTCSVNIHIQNAVLYSFGLVLNLALFFFLPDLFGQNDSKKHFFEGYSLSVLAIILCNSVLGIVITFGYKYADVIVKTFSTACATGVLLYINVAVFELKSNLTVFLGAIVIFVSSYLFLLVKSTPTIVPADLDFVVNATPNEKTKWKWMQNFRWKYRLISFATGSLVFCFVASLSPSGTFFRSTNKFYLTKSISSSPFIIRIEQTRPNRPVVIYGINLCTDKTLNATVRVLVNSNICYPIEFCSSQIISCYLQGTLTDQSLSGTVDISLIKSVKGSSTSITTNTTVPYTISLSYWEKNDVVLVVHFNKPYYERISFLTIYRHLFPLVLFTGHEPHPDIIQCPPGPAAIKVYGCLTQAVLVHPNHNGYLFAHFDLLPIFYRLKNTSLTSFWLPHPGCAPKPNGWYWWSQGSGVDALNKVFDEVKVNIQNTTFHGRYDANYRKHTGQGYCAAYSDIFYLPQRFVPDWLVLSNLFDRHGVFHEIGYATIIYMIISGNLSANLETIQGIVFGSIPSFEKLEDDPSVQFVHRIELPSQSQRHLVESVVYRSLPTTEIESQVMQNIDIEGKLFYKPCAPFINPDPTLILINR